MSPTRLARWIESDTAHGTAFMITVNFAALLDAYQFASPAGTWENSAFVDLENGSIYCASSEIETEEELPEDLETSDRYLILPDKNDLNLGRELALSFVEQELPDEQDKAMDCFRSKGAYRCFKELLEKHEALGKWYAFEAQATQTALREWCHDRGIQLVNVPSA